MRRKFVCLFVCNEYIEINVKYHVCSPKHEGARRISHINHICRTYWACVSPSDRVQMEASVTMQ